VPGQGQSLVSMRDVARLAGVSVATVSAVINEKGTVSTALTERVAKAMQALDYHPDHIARSLRVGRSNVIGMIVPDISNLFFAEILRGVEESSEQKGYSVILCDSNEDSARERRHLATLYSRRVDGVLLASSISQAAHDRLTLRRFPIVFIDSVPAGVENGVVIVDNVEAAYTATRHLIDLGHRRIAIISGRLDRSVGLDRMNGYRKALQEAGIWTPEEFIQHGDFHVESGYRCGSELMRLTVPPTAIFSCNNRMTLGLLRALGDLGINCPGRVSVVGFDDVDWSTTFSPRLTCVAQPTYEIGKRATEMLLEKILAADGHASDRYPNAVLRAELRVRESTAVPLDESLLRTTDRR
jgi:LacI family transcriptional regulator